MENERINGDLCHDKVIKATRSKLRYARQKNYDSWKIKVRKKFEELLGLREIEKNACPLCFKIEWMREEKDYRLIRFTFESEVGAVVPCYLAIPKTGKEKYPVAITMQGHTTGFHVSIGKKLWKADDGYQPQEAFALQAVQNGFAALAIEQRGMGERRSWRSYGKDNVYQDRGHMCAVPSLVALSLGRTIIGERVWDISKAIDLLGNFSACDTDKIMIMGNSGGGTASYYAACYDERIKYSVPSCSFCSYKTSILDIEHCACNYIPNILQWFEMEDLACLIAPRSLTVVAGSKDIIFPIDGVRKSFETVKEIYRKAGAEEKCALVETPNAHYWNENIVWKAVREETERLGW